MHVSGRRLALDAGGLLLGCLQGGSVAELFLQVGKHILVRAGVLHEGSDVVDDPTCTDVSILALTSKSIQSVVQ